MYVADLFSHATENFQKYKRVRLSLGTKVVGWSTVFSNSSLFFVGVTVKKSPPSINLQLGWVFNKRSACQHSSSEMVDALERPWSHIKVPTFIHPSNPPAHINLCHFRQIYPSLGWQTGGAQTDPGKAVSTVEANAKACSANTVAINQ